MKRLIIISILLYLVCIQNYAQNTFFAKYIIPASIYISGVKAMPDNGYIISGKSYNSITSHTYMLLMKTDSNANVLWNYYYGTGDTNIGSISAINAIAEIKSGFVVTGEQSKIESAPYGLLIAKINNTGQMQWCKSFSASSNNTLDGIGLGITTNDDRYAAVGINEGDNMLMFVETDTMGNLKHFKDFGFSKSMESIGFGIQSCGKNNGYIITGTTADTMEVGGGYLGELYLMRLDSAANIEWTKIYKSGATSSNGYIVKPTYDKGFIIIGRNLYSSYEYRLLIKTDASGNIQWAYRYNFNDNGCGGLPAGCVARDSGYVVTGGYTVVFKTDATGHIIWSKDMDPPENTSAIIKAIDTTRDGGIIMAGTTSDRTMLIKADINGTVGCAEKNYAGSTSVYSPEVLQWGEPYDSVITYSITPGDSVFSVFTYFCNVGIEEVSNDNNISVFPNPSTNDITVEMPSCTKDAMLSIYSIQGELLMQHPIQQKTMIDVSALPSGVYVIQVKSEKVNKVGKFVKE